MPSPQKHRSGPIPIPIKTVSPIMIPPARSPEERELKNSLQEALTCSSCKTITHLPRARCHQDYKTGTYIPSREALPTATPSQSPFRISRSDSICPLQKEPGLAHIQDTTLRINPTSAPARLKPSYARLMTPAQHRLYHDLIERYIDSDPGRDALYAQYRVDFHIHLHYLCGRGVLSFCRDVGEMHEVRRWRWRVDGFNEVQAQDADGGQDRGERRGVGTGEDREHGQGKEEGIAEWQRHGGGRRGRRRRGRRWGWPGDEEGLVMMYQTALWRRLWVRRRKRVDEARVKWGRIMEERTRQRLKERRRQRYAPAVKVRLYYSVAGRRSLLREAELQDDSFGEAIR